MENELKVGSCISYFNRGTLNSILKIQRETKTRWVIKFGCAEVHLRKSDLRPIGRGTSPWDSSTYEATTDEHWRLMKFRRMVVEIENTDWRSLSMCQLERIQSILAGGKQGTK